MALAGPASGENIAYKYDGLGRLVRVERTGSANEGVNTNYSFDCAGNRSSVASGSGVPAAPPPPACTSSGTPPPGNAAPIALNDSGSQGRCTTATYSVLANDSDPDGPQTDLNLVSVTGIGFSLASPTTVQFLAPVTTGGKSATYIVQDLYGATASATLTVNVTTAGGNCQ